MDKNPENIEVLKINKVEMEFLFKIKGNCFLSDEEKGRASVNLLGIYFLLLSRLENDFVCF